MTGLSFLLLLGCASPQAGPIPSSETLRVAEPVPTVEPAPDLPADPSAYPWRDAAAPYRPLGRAIPAPEGYTRPPLEGYAAWIRALPLAPAGSPVRTWRGEELWSGQDPRLLAVVDLDVGDADLQQCADTILRLRAEWAWHQGDSSVAFRFTSGDLSSWARWADGERPSVSGSKVSWARSARPDASRQSYKSWMKNLFTYAGTRSLAREGVAVAAADVLPGDFLSLGGSPGHALVVLDLARDATGRAAVLIGEGYMPAQDMHVLAGPLEGWYPVDEAVQVPTWPDPFPWTALRRFQDGA